MLYEVLNMVRMHTQCLLFVFGSAPNHLREGSVHDAIRNLPRSHCNEMRTVAERQPFLLQTTARLVLGSHE